MKERPILWSGPLVLALLAGRKSQTRRLWPAHRRPAPGDVLWGRETWGWLGEHRFKDHRSIMWRATQGESIPNGGWRPSIFMPRWACRLFHEVVAVREELLQDITEADARAEGVMCPHGNDQSHLDAIDAGEVACSPRTLFAALWDRINGKRASWASNPRVAVVTFRPRVG